MCWSNGDSCFDMQTIPILSEKVQMAFLCPCRDHRSYSWTENNIFFTVTLFPPHISTFVIWPQLFLRQNSIFSTVTSFSPYYNIWYICCKITSFPLSHHFHVLPYVLPSDCSYFLLAEVVQQKCAQISIPKKHHFCTLDWKPYSLLSRICCRYVAAARRCA